jgi:hypothetical protein
MDKPIAKLKLLTTKGEVVDAILYCHQETTTIAGTTYYLLKLNTPADASGTTLSASTASVARVVWGKFVYPLTGIAKILASTIYATYRAYTGGGTVNAEIDILIRQADGTVRTTIATGVSKSENLGSSWATYTGASYAFAEYTVVDQTDYLEIDYVANVTAKKATQYAYLRIDDNTLNLADQTRSQEWKFTGVTTLSATNVTSNSATLNGQINGTETLTIRGFEWGTQSGNYTDSWTESGTFPPDTFSYNLTNLLPATTYYFRAKAYSDATGWIYGNEVAFTTLSILPVGWSYRKSHVINPASGAGANYPIRITVHYGSGTDSGEDVYLNGKCRTDFGDIRFTLSDGVSLLDYWMESKVDGDYAVFWVQITGDLSTNPVTIYIYYGNPNATRADDPQNIDLWQLREHQISTSYYPDIRFSKPTASVIRIDSYTAGSSSLGQGYVFIIMPKSFLHGKKVKVYWNVYYSYADTRDLILGMVIVLDAELNRKQTLAIDIIESLFTYIEATHYPGPLGAPAGWLGWRTDTSGVLDLSTFTEDYVTLMIRLRDDWTGQTVMVDVDWLKILDASDNVLLTFDFTQSVVMEVTGTYEDYGLYRKYVSPEPSHGSWGSEETVAVAEAIVAKNFPMDYLPSPVKAAQLTSKVSGATITTGKPRLPADSN